MIAAANYQRVINAVLRKPYSIVFCTAKGDVSVSREVDYHLRRAPLDTIVGVYDSHARPEWIEEDLIAAGVDIE